MKALKIGLGTVVLAVLVVVALDAIPYKNAEAAENCALTFLNSGGLRLESGYNRVDATGLDEMAKLSAMANDLAQAGICRF